MYSGKTSGMLRAVRAARLSRAFAAADGSERITVVRSQQDTRSPTSTVVSRDGLMERGAHVRVVASMDEVTPVPGGLLAVDEAQFFADGSLLRAWQAVRKAEGAMLVSGLDRDFMGRPFGDVLALARMHMEADLAPGRGLPEPLVRIYRLVSKCAVCGAPAALTARVIPAPAGWASTAGHGGGQTPHARSDDQVLVGDKDSYQAVCLAHHGGGLLVRQADDPDSPLLGSADGAVVFARGDGRA